MNINTLITTLRAIAHNLHHRRRSYSELVGWLLSTVTRHFHRPLMLSAGTSVASVVLHGASLGIVAGALHQFQEHGALQAFPGLQRFGIELAHPSPVAVILCFVVLFVLGNASAYLSRATAIRLDTNIYLYFYERVFSFLEKRPPADVSREAFRDECRRLDDRHSIMKIVGADARFGGIVVRMGLSSIIHFGHVLVGLLIVARYAPALLSFIAAFVAICASIMYPLNLQATRTTHLLEDFGPRRGAYLRKRLRNALDRESDSETEVFDDGEMIIEGSGPGEAASKWREDDSGAVVVDYQHVMENRLRVLETSRLLLSSMVALAIGGLLWMVSQEADGGTFGYGSLLTLFLGLRFVMNGFQGIMVMLTSVNRFLPNLLRLANLIRAIDDIERRRS